MSKSLVNNNIIINEPRGVRGMIISQRSDSSLNIFHSRKSPFVSMINVKDKLGLPPIKGTVINRRSLNNNVFHNNQLIKRKKEPSLEKYCSLKTAQQFWKKNINPYLEMNKDSNKYNMSSKEIKDQIELEEAEKKKENIDNKKFNRSSSCFNINKILWEENNNNITNNKNDSGRNNCSEHEEVTITKITKKSDIDNKPKEEEKKEEEKEPETKEEKKEENIDDILNDDDEKMDEAEMKDVLGYINSLDYEKYAKDMEIREALQLIKNKMEKDKEEQKEPVTNTIQSNTTDTVPKETKEEEKLPEIAEPKPVTPIVNKEEEKKQEEIKQFKIAEKIAKDEVIIFYLYIEIESCSFISVDKTTIGTTRTR